MLTSQRTPTKAFYSSRPESAWDFTNVRLIFMNDSFLKCVSSILNYWRNVLITEENYWINQPHSVVHPGLYCRWTCPHTLQNSSKLIALVMRIELTRAILMPIFPNFLINLTIYFRMFLYLVICFLRVTVSLLIRSQGRTIQSPLTN